MENRHFFPGKSVLHRPKIGYGFSTNPFQSIDMPIFQAVPAILAKNTPFDGVIRFPYPMRIPPETSRLSLACLARKPLINRLRQQAVPPPRTPLWRALRSC